MLSSVSTCVTKKVFNTVKTIMKNADHMLNKIAIQCNYNNCKKHAQLFVLSINCTISLLSSKSALIDIIGALI